MANLTFEGRLSNLGDLQKTYMWELYIPAIAGIITDDMLVRVRNAQIPGRTIEQITSFFMGTKQKFPGKTTFEDTFPTVFEEFEDGKVRKALHAWMEAIYKYDAQADDGGAASGDKSEITGDITLRLLSTQGEKIGDIKFFNCWPTGIAPVDLSYESGEAIKYNVTWSFDFWRPID